MLDIGKGGSEVSVKVQAQSKKSAEPGKPPTINYKGELNHIAQHVISLRANKIVFRKLNRRQLYKIDACSSGALRV